jgi:hypothetical protein
MQIETVNLMLRRMNYVIKNNIFLTYWHLN